MRRYSFFVAVVSVLVAAPAFAQNYPAEAVILLPEVEVRSGCPRCVMMRPDHNPRVRRCGEVADHIVGGDDLRAATDSMWAVTGPSAIAASNAAPWLSPIHTAGRSTSLPV